MKYYFRIHHITTKIANFVPVTTDGKTDFSRAYVYCCYNLVLKKYGCRNMQTVYI